MGKTAGFEDKLESKKFSFRYFSTSMKHDFFRSLVKLIEGLKSFQGFEFVKDDCGFLGSRTGKGATVNGRKPEQFTLTLRILDRQDSDMIIDDALRARLDALLDDIAALPELKVHHITLVNFLSIEKYSLLDNKPPEQIVLLFEFKPPEQEELDKVTADGNFAELCNKVLLYLLPDKPDGSLQELREMLKERMKAVGRG
jgi:hypothetical protein